MNKIAIQLLVEIAEKCEQKIKTEKDLSKRELYSKAWAQVTDLLDEEVNGSEDITSG